MFQLEHCKDRRADIVFMMAQKGLIHALNEEVLETHKEEKILEVWPSLGYNEVNSPDFPPTPEELRQILKQDIEGENSYRFTHSCGSLEGDIRAIEKLLDNIGNPTFSEIGSIVYMQCPTFDQLFSGSKVHSYLDWTNEGLISESAFYMTVTPANQVFELSHYEHDFCSTLLTGTKVILAFPPLHGNVDVLREAYNEAFEQKSSKIAPKYFTKLQHGIAIIQKPGQILSIPPYWAILTFCTEASTSSDFFVTLACDFMERLQYVDVFLAMNPLWYDKEQEQIHLVDYATKLGDHFRMVLGKEVDNFSTDQTVIEICRAWTGGITQPTQKKVTKDTRRKSGSRTWAAKTVPDSIPIDEAAGESKNKEALMHKVVRLCELIEDAEKRASVEQLFQTAWTDLLKEKIKKKPECRLCHLRLDQMQEGDSRHERLENHFHTTHWVRKS